MDGSGAPPHPRRCAPPRRGSQPQWPTALRSSHPRHRRRPLATARPSRSREHAPRSTRRASRRRRCTSACAARPTNWRAYAQVRDDAHAQAQLVRCQAEARRRSARRWRRRRASRSSAASPNSLRNCSWSSSGSPICSSKWPREDAADRAAAKGSEALDGAARQRGARRVARRPRARRPRRGAGARSCRRRRRRRGRRGEALEAAEEGAPRRSLGRAETRAAGAERIAELEAEKAAAEQAGHASGRDRGDGRRGARRRTIEAEAESSAEASETALRQHGEWRELTAAARAAEAAVRTN